MAKATPVIPWTRYWCPLGQPINCGDSGREFLADPDGDFGRIWSPNTFELEQILGRPCLILVGEPGIGKTTAIELAREAIVSRPGADPNPLWLGFREIPTEQVFHRRTVETDKWQTWLRSETRLTLVVDGIDEGLIRVPGFVSYLAAELRGVPIARLQLILVCRTAEWSSAEGGQLGNLWGDSDSPAVYELCPLRYKDAKLAAQIWNVDPEKFMSTVQEHHAAGLAARPTTLFFLLREFAARGEFPGTHFDLYRAGCERLCDEHDFSRMAAFRFQATQLPQFAAAQIIEMAARIAALFILGGKSTIYVGPEDDAEPSDLLLQDVAQDLQSLQLAQTALSTGLFSARGRARLGFAHQTFAECLAAQTLQNLPLAQVRRLLCQRDSAVEHVVPQLAETAAWLAAARVDFLKFLIGTEPEVLLRSDVSRIQAQHKEELVTVLLDRVKREEAFDDRDISRFYSSLKHPTLAKSLWEYVRNPDLNLVVRRMAIEIARDCKLEELLGEALALLRIEPHSTIRSQLAQLLERITPPQRAAELIPLAKGEVGTDIDDTIKGCALHALIPGVWSVSDALPFLRHPNETFYGAYRLALSNLIPKHIRPGDLKPLLRKLLDWDDCFDSLNPFRDIAVKTMTEAIRTLDDPAIAEAAVEVWRQKSRQSLHFAESADSELNHLFETDPAVRVAFLESILKSPGTTPDDIYHLGGINGNLLVEQDLPILLQRISYMPSERRSVWATAIWLLARPGRENAVARCWDLLLDQISNIPELQDRFRWLRAYELDEPEALHLKQIWLEEQQRREDWEKRKRNAPAPEALVQRDLVEIQAGKTFWWMQLCKDLTLRAGDTHYRPLEHDVCESPGWKGANEQHRNEIIEAARQFLLRHEDGYAKEGARTNYSDPGYLAIWLVRDEIRQNPGLRNAVSQNWIDAITGRFGSGQEHHQEMVALAYELNRDRCIQGLVREILDDDARHGQILALSSYRRCWDARLTQELVNLISTGRLKSTSIESSLSFLSEADSEAAVRCVRLLLPPGIEQDELEKERTKGVLCVAFAKLTAATWDVAWPLIQGHYEFAEHVLVKLAYGIEYSAKTAVLPFASEPQLSEIYLLLQRVFPPETDAPIASGEVTPRQCIPQLRGELISTLTARGNDAACRELLRLSEAVPKERVWLRWRYWEAIRLKRRRTWQPLPPQVVRSMLDNPAARVIEDENDLIAVIIESLDRFQANLTKSSPPQAGFLWNYEGSGNQRKNFSPKDEEDLSDMIAAWLTNDIGPKAGVVIGREVQPRRGQKTDIKVVAIPTGAGAGRPLTVVIEVKGCWHREVRTAIKAQLVEDYLNKNGWTHGVYVVGWYMCDHWNNPDKPPVCNLNSKSYEDACKEVEHLAAPYSGEGGSAIAKAVCLDCRFPA